MTLSEEGEGGEETPPTVEDGGPEPLELPETDSTQTSETGRFCSFIAMVTSCHGYQPRDTTYTCICSHLSLRPIQSPPTLSISHFANTYRNTCGLGSSLVPRPSYRPVFVFLQCAKTEGEF